MQILITGATGLVGNNCLRAACNAGHDAHVLVRPEHDQRPFEGLEVTRHFGNLLQPKELAATIPDVDAIIHSAGDTHIGHQPRPQQRIVNVDATKALAAEAGRRGIRFVFISSVDALPCQGPNRLVTEMDEGPAKFPCGYVQTKRDAEAALLGFIQEGLDATIVNPGFMLGPWDWKPSSGRMLLEVATRFTPFGPKGGFSVCDIREVALAVLRLATSPHEHRRYILAGNNIRYVDAWSIFAKVSGSNGPLCPAGPIARKLAGAWGDLRTKLSGKEGDINSAAIGMSELFHYYDSSRAENELGYRIPSVEECSRAAWSWFQEYGYVPGTNPSQANRQSG